MAHQTLEPVTLRTRSSGRGRGLAELRSRGREDSDDLEGRLH